MFRLNSLFALLLAVMLAAFTLSPGVTGAIASEETGVAAGDNPAVANDELPGRDPGIEGISANPPDLEMSLYSGGGAKPSVNIINANNQAFSYKVEVDVTEQPDGVQKVPNPAGKKFLVMQDQSNWGWLHTSLVGRVQGALYEQMTDYNRIGSPNLDLFAYDAVIVAFNVQSANWQNKLIASRAWFEDYVARGGALYIESGGNSGGYWEVPLPGNIPSYYGPDGRGKVALDPKDNLLVSLCGWQNGQQLMDGSWTHQYYRDADFRAANLPWYQIIATSWSYADRANLIAYGYGKGAVLVYGGPVCYNWVNSASGSNFGNKPTETLSYLLSFRQSPWLTVTPEAGTVSAGKDAVATLTFNTFELKEGDYSADVKFISTADKNQYMVVPVTMHVTAAGKIEAKWTAGSGYPAKIDYNASFAELFDTGLYNVPVTITNKGNKELNVTNVKFIGSQYFKVRRNQFAVAPGKSHEMQVALRAQQSGRHTATMAIYSDDPYQPVLEIPVVGETKVPPVITVNVEQIEDNIYTGDFIQEDLTIGNVGRANLNYKTKFEVTSPPARPAGQELRNVNWRGNTNGGINAGLSWDEENQRMWVTSYNNNWIAALDKNGNEVIAPFGAQNNPNDCAWANGRLYVTCNDNYYIYMYDANRNYLGNFYNNGNWNVYRIGLAYDPATGVFMAGDNNDWGQLRFFKHTPQTGYQYLGNYYGLATLRNSQDGYYPRSMDWVPAHKGGNLWVTSYNYVWQFDVEPASIKMNKLTSSIQKPWGSRSEWDGIGHDGENLWWKRYDSQNYVVLSDGVEEKPWLKVALEGGVTEGTLKTDQEINGYIMVDARGREPGEFKGKVVIESNDPITPTIVIPINVAVEAAPRLKVYWSAGYPDVVDYNKAFQGIFIDRNYQITLNVKNEGTERLNVQDIVDEMGWFTPNVRQFSLDPGKAQVVVVTFRDAEVGEHESVLSFTSNDPDEILDLPVSALASLPPIIDVDPQQINEQVSTGQRLKTPVVVANEGDSPLYYNVTGGGAAGQFGNLLSTWQWNRNTSSNGYRAGIAYDKDRNWMWLSYYNNGWVGAVNKDNRQEQGLWGMSNNGNPMGVAYHNNTLYVIQWSWSGIGRYNNGGGWLGGWGFNYTPTAVATIPEKNYLITLNSNDRDQIVVHDIAQNGAEVKRISGMNALIGGVGYSRSITWVSSHLDGELYINHTHNDGWNRIVQAKLDIAAGKLTKIREFRAPYQQNDEWSGIGHDGTNLWWGPYQTNIGSYYIIDDGVDEGRWVWYKPETGVVEPGDAQDVWFTLDASRLAAGNYNKNITIKSNENNDVVVQIAIQVVNSPNAEVIWEEKHGYPDFINFNQRFGDVIANEDYNYTVVVKNNGTQNLQIESLFPEGDNADFYTVDPEAINQLTPGQSANVTVTFNAPDEEGEYPVELVLLTNGNPNDVVRYDMYARVDGAPVLTLDPEDGMAVELLTNGKTDGVLTVGNEGRGPLRVNATLSIVDEPARDGSVYGEEEVGPVRQARQLGDGSVPTRDGKLGDQLGKVTWRYNANGYMNMGLSWDDANQRMWVTNYNNNVIAAIDKSGNEVVVAFGGHNNSSGCVWANDRLYVTCNDSYYIYMYDGNRNYLGNFYNNGNWNVYRQGITYDPASKVFMAGDNNDWGQLRFFKHTPQTGYQYLGNFYGIATLRNSQDGYMTRSMVWVPMHKGGQLWTTSYNYIWQYDVDPANVRMTKLTSSLQKPWGSRSEYDGIGHDGDNLWLKRYDTNEYIILDDGIIEYPWILSSPDQLVLDPGESEEITVKFDARNRAGSYKAQLKLATNDPDQKSVAYPIELKAIPVAKLELTWAGNAGYPNNINFNGALGTVYTRQKYEVPVTIVNKGNGSLKITGLSVAGDVFSSDPSRDFTLLPGKSRVVKVILNSEESGAKQGAFAFNTNDANRPNVAIPLSANLTGAAAMVLDRDDFATELTTGAIWNADLNISNVGESQLTFAMTGSITQAAARDDGLRQARTLGDLDETRELKWGTPLRDGKAGDVIGTVTWRYNYANQYLSGLSWDEENQRMWVASYNQNMIAAIDKNGNEVVSAFNGQNNPTDIQWANGRLYVTCNDSYYIYMYDANRSYLGNFYNNGNWNVYRMGIAYDPDSKVFMAGDNNDWGQLRFFKHTPQTGYQYLGNYYGVATLRNSQDGSYGRSMDWVPAHRGGNLWLGSTNYVWQYDVDPATLTMKKLTSSIAKPGASKTEYDAIGHDGKNLWIKRYDQNYWTIVDDGLKEVPLLTFEPRSGVVAPNESLDAVVTFNTHGISGRLTGTINIATNVGTVKVPVDIKVGDGAHLDVSWEEEAGYPDMIDFNAKFPEVYPGKSYRVALDVTNPGTEWLDIDEVSFVAPADVFAVTEDRFSLGPKETAKINVTLFAGAEDIGNMGGVMLFKTNDPNREEFEIALGANVSTPPVINLVNDGDIEKTLVPNEQLYYPLEIANEGGSPLRVRLEHEMAEDEAVRDDAVRIRNARRVGLDEENTAGPMRDAAGDILGSVSWQYNGNGYTNAGIEWHAESQLMYVSSYNNNVISAIDKNGNQVKGPVNCQYGSVLDMTIYKNKIFYHSYSTDYYYMVYDLNLNYLTRVYNNGNFQTRRQGALAVDPETGVFMHVPYYSYDYIYFFKINPDNYQYQFLTNANIRSPRGNVDDRAGGMVWVPEHKGGNLYLRTVNWVWRFDIDTKNYRVNKLVSQFAVPAGWSKGFYEGIGHDGKDLWMKRYDSNLYYLIEDGIDEYPLFLYAEQETIVPPNSSASLDLTLSGINKSGEYQATLRVVSNDPVNSLIEIPATITIGDGADIAVEWPTEYGYPGKFDWDAYLMATTGNPVYVGADYPFTFKVTNNGTRALTVELIQGDNEDLFANPDAFGLNAGESRDVVITLNAAEVGESVTNITFFSDDINQPEYAIPMHYTAGEPPVLSLEWDNLDVEIAAGGTWASTLDIANEGAVPLNWKFDGGGGNAEEFGKEVRTWQWNRNTSSNYRAGIAYDSDRNWMWLTQYNNAWLGAVNLANMQEVNLWGCSENGNPMGAAYHNGTLYIIKWAWGGIGRYNTNGQWIGGWGFNYTPTAVATIPERNWLLTQSDNNRDELVVHDIGANGNEVMRITGFRQVCENNSSRSMTWVSSHDAGQLYVNYTYGDGYPRIAQCQIDFDTKKVTKVREFKFPVNNNNEWNGLSHDGENLWYGPQSSPTYAYYIIDDGVNEGQFIFGTPKMGSLNPGDMETIDIVIDAGKLDEGEYETEFWIRSNDPNNPEGRIPVMITVVASSFAFVTIEGRDEQATVVDWNEYYTTEFDQPVYDGGKFIVPLQINNTGTLPLTVEEVSVDDNNGVFSADRDNFPNIQPGSFEILNVMLEADEPGEYTADLWIVTDAAVEPIELKIELKAVAIAGPRMVLDPQEIDLGDMVPGQKKFQPIVISNDGQANLVYEVELVEWEEEEVARDNKVRSARRLGESAVPTRDAIQLEGLYAIFQDQGAWAWMDGNMMTRLGVNRINPGQPGPGWVSYRNANDLNAVDFSQYNVIVMASGNQSGTWNNNHNNNRERLEEYVSNGGAIYYEMGNSNGIRTPGNITNDMNGGESNGRMITTYDKNDANYSLWAELANSEHGGGWGIGHVIRGNSWAHSEFSQNQFTNNAMLDWYQAIAVTEGRGQWALIAYGIGKGAVLLCGAPTGYVWDNWRGNGNYGETHKVIISYLEQMSNSATTFALYEGNAGNIAQEEWVTAKGPYTVRPGNQSTISLVADASGLEPGEYGMDIVFTSNVGTATIPVMMNVFDAPAISVIPGGDAPGVSPVDFTTTDFGATYIDFPEMIEIEVFNVGSQKVEIDEIESDNQNFDLHPGDPRSFDLEVGESRTLTVVFNPGEPGLHEGNIWIVSNDGREEFADGYPIRVTGLAFWQPEMWVNPDDLSRLVVPAGFEEIISLEITNASPEDGGGDLVWWAKLRKGEREEPQARDIQGPQRQARRLGETVAERGFNTFNGTPTRDAVGGMWAVFQDQSSWGWLADVMVGRVLGKKNAGQFDVNGYHDYRNPADWNTIDFYAYDGIVIAAANNSGTFNTNYQNNFARFEQYIAKGGAAYLETRDLSNGLAAPGNIKPIDNYSTNYAKTLISPDPANPKYSLLAKLAQQQLGGNYWNLGHNLYGTNFLYGSYEPAQFTDKPNISWFQPILAHRDRGNDNLPGAVAYKYGRGGVLVVACLPGYVMTNFRGTDGWGAVPGPILEYTLSLADGIAPIDFVANNGIVPAGETGNLDLFIDAAMVKGETFEGFIDIFSNDPIIPEDRELGDDAQPDIVVPVALTVRSKMPYPDFYPKSLNFGENIVGQDRTQSFTFSNIGNDKMEITEITISDEDNFRFEPGIEFPFILGAGEDIQIPVTYFGAEPGMHEATLELQTDVPNADEGLLVFELTGYSFTSPTVEIAPAELNVELDALFGETAELEFAIRNIADPEDEPGMLRWTTIVRDPNEPVRGIGRIARRIDAPVNRYDAVPTRDEPTSRFAMFAQANPWGYDLERIFQNVDGMHYDRYESMDNFDQVNLNDYGVIWFGNNQVDRWNTIYNNNLARIEEWVANGGVYYMATGTMQWTVAPKHPGGLVRTPQIYNNSATVVVEQMENEFVRMAGWQKGEQLVGSAFSHTAYAISDIEKIENSDYYQVIVQGNQIAHPITVMYQYGNGFAVVSGTNDGFLHGTTGNKWGEASEWMVWYLDGMTPKGDSWLTLAPPSGRISAGEEQIVSVKVDAGKVAGAPGQEFSYDVVVKTNDAENPEVNVRVTLTLMPEPDWVVTPSRRMHKIDVEEVTIDGHSARGLYLGAYTGETFAAYTRWLATGPVAMTLYGDNLQTEEVEGFKPGEKINFLLYDKKHDITYNNVRIEQIEGAPLWALDGYSKVRILANSRSAEEEQTITLNKGWNLISLNVEPGEDMFREGETRGADIVKMTDNMKIDDKHYLVLMKNAAGQFYTPQYGFNNIPYWDAKSAYWVKMDSTMDVSWTGSPFLAGDPIPLKKGVNFVAYYPDYELTVNAPDFHAVQEIAGSIDILKDGAGKFALPKFGWSNIGTMKPGQGYIVKMSADAVLSYPGKAMDVAGVEAEVAVPEHWAMSAVSDQNMSVLVKSVKGYVPSAGDQIGAFDASGNLVGVGSFNADGTAGVAVFGDDPTTDAVEGLSKSAPFELRIWNSTDRAELKVVLSSSQYGNGLSYQTDGLSVIDVSAVALPTEYYVSSAYPNPFNAVTRLNYGMPDAGLVKIAVFDVTGRLVQTLYNGNQVAGHHTVVWSSQATASGIYLIKVESGAFRAVKKVTLLK